MILERLSLKSAEDYDSFEVYLNENGYSPSEQSVMDFITKPTIPAEYLYVSGTGAEGMFPDSFPMYSCPKMVLICEYYRETEQKAAYYFECNGEKHAQEVEAWYAKNLKDDKVSSEIYGTKVLVVMYHKTEQEQTRKPLSTLSLSEAAGHDSFSAYLEASGYSKFEGTIAEYTSANPAPYSFKIGTGSDLPSTQFPEELLSANVLGLFAGEFNSIEQTSGFYAEYEDHQAASAALEILNANMVPEGASPALSEVLDNKLLWGLVNVNDQPQPDQPTTSRRTIFLRNIIRKSGLHTVEIAAYNRAGEGPRVPFDVQIAGYPFTKDNEEVHFTREGEAVTEMLSCGCMFDVYTNNESKMLPESIQINNVVGNHYIRYDDLRHGYIEVYEPKGEVQFIFGELPDYANGETNVKKIFLMTADGDNIATLETEATYWRELPNYDDRFSMEIRDSDLLTYLAFTDGDIKYRLHVDYNSKIGDSVEIEVSLAG